MKIAFDEHIPPAMVKVFQDLAAERGFRRQLRNVEIVKAKDYSPQPGDADYIRKSDVPWIRRYRTNGGRVIVSGNTRMVSVPQELLALQNCGMVVFFFPSCWNNWQFPRKCAMLLAWIERIVAHARLSKPAMLYRIPESWSEDADFLVIRQPTPLQLKGQHGPDVKAKAVAQQARVRKSKAAAKVPDLLDLMQPAKADAE